MAFRRTTWAFVLGSLVACGGATYGGLGDDPVDDAALGDDAGADAIFSVDDGATGDDASDSANVDATLVDSGADAIDAADTADAGDSTVADAADALDSTVDAADSATADTLVDDAMDAADAMDAMDAMDADDGATIDSGAVDSGAVDSGAVDSGAVDSAPADTGVIDSAPADTGVVDTGVDAGPLQTNPGQVYCSNSSGATDLLCGSGQDCCGALQWNGSWDYSCGNGCSFGQRDFACNEKADCGGKWCCASNKPFSSDINGSSCSSSGCGNQTLCMTASDCPSGKTCVAQTVIDSGGKITIGVCQ